jgi:uncharacterized protein (DUF305 family)
MRYTKYAFVMPAIAAAVLALSACGSSDSGSSASETQMGSMSGMDTTAPATSAPSSTVGPPASGAHNSADVDFATGMIMHHAQAIEMADLILARTDNAKVKALATRIKEAQSPEIATMSGWLKGWNAMIPDTSQPMANGMSMDGMMSSADTDKLKSASMAKADKVFLTLMPEHHAGAIATAKKELTAGTNPEAKKLAQSIISTQTAEITEMNALRASIS